MTGKKDYEARTEAILIPIMAKHGFELVDVEYVKEMGNFYLRAYIDKEGGITIDDCEVVSRELDEILDREDFIEESYILEVSSPGLGRPLKKEKDFARSIGKEVDIKLFKSVDKVKDFTGVLVDYDPLKVVIALDDETTVEFARKDIAMIRLSFDF